MENIGKPKLNTIVKNISLENFDGSPVKISGFVGKGPKGFVRVYFTLGLSSYVDIPEDDLTYLIEAEKDDMPATFFVKGSSDLTVTVRGTTSTKAVDIVASRATKTKSCNDLAINARLPGEDFCFDVCIEMFHTMPVYLFIINATEFAHTYFLYRLNQSRRITRIKTGSEQSNNCTQLGSANNFS